MVCNPHGEGNPESVPNVSAVTDTDTQNVEDITETGNCESMSLPPFPPTTVDGAVDREGNEGTDDVTDSPQENGVVTRDQEGRDTRDHEGSDTRPPSRAIAGRVTVNHTRNICNIWIS